MIVVLGSIRGSPGVTSWSLLLAAAWPPHDGVERVVLEADPSGGVLGARYGWGVEPGVVSLVAALRRNGEGPVPVAEHGRLPAPGLWVVPGPETGERARSVLGAAVHDLAGPLTADERVWLVDAGRLEEPNPSLGLIGEAATVTVLCGGRPEDVVAVPSTVESLRARGTKEIAVLVTSTTSYRRDEISEFTGADRCWLTGEAGDLREVVAAVLGSGRRARRSMVWRHALEVATELSSAAATATPRSVR